MKQYYKEGFGLISENAKTLFEVSEISAQLKHYGVACSLMILSAEESMKAIMCALKFNEPTFPLADWEKVFFKHKVKHRRIEGTLTVAHIRNKRLNELRNEMSAKVRDIAAKNGHDPDQFEDAYWQKMNTEDGLSRYSDEPEIDVTEVLEWWHEADRLKNAGLYVNNATTSWETPKTITDDDFEKAKKFATLLSDYGKDLMRFYEKHYVPIPPTTSN